MNNEEMVKNIGIIEGGIDCLQEQLPDIHPAFFCVVLMQRSCDIAFASAKTTEQAESDLRSMFEICITECKNVVR